MKRCGVGEEGRETQGREEKGEKRPLNRSEAAQRALAVVPGGLSLPPSSWPSAETAARSDCAALVYSNAAAFDGWLPRVFPGYPTAEAPSGTRGEPRGATRSTQQRTEADETRLDFELLPLVSSVVVPLVCSSLLPITTLALAKSHLFIVKRKGQAESPHRLKGKGNQL